MTDEQRPVIRASDVPVYTYERLQQSLRTWCPSCRRERDVDLPKHPAGLGTCTTCGSRLDLCDTDEDERREFHAYYRKSGTVTRARAAGLPEIGRGTAES